MCGFCRVVEPGLFIETSLLFKNRSFPRWLLGPAGLQDVRVFLIPGGTRKLREATGLRACTSTPQPAGAEGSDNATGVR